MKENNYIEAIKKVMDNCGMGIEIKENEDSAIFYLPMAAENAPGFNIRLRVNDDGSSKFWCYLANNVKPEKCQSMVNTLNKINNTYRYVKFSLDDDRDIFADYNFILYGDEEAAAVHVLGMLYIFSDILDHSFERIMMTLWSKDTSPKLLKTDEIKTDLFGEGDDK